MNTISFLTLILLLFHGCIRQAPEKPPQKSTNTDELVVYCENGVLQPVREISERFRTLHQVKVRIQNDCSQNLISLIQYTREADIFIPDTRQAIRKLHNVHPDLFSDSVFIGFNPMVFMVAKGNPLKFDGRFESVLDRRLGIILANPETSSLGYETETLLKNRSIFEPVMRENVVALSVDSRGLLKNVAMGQAALTIDWLSSYYQNNAHLLVDTLSLPQTPHLPSIYAASLSESSHPAMSKAFLQILNSEFATETFRKYGIQKRPSIVF